jgi:hypothetical protein
MTMSKKPKPYDAIVWERKVRVSIPEDPMSTDLLKAAIRQNLMPATIAAVIVCLQPATTRDAGVNRQLNWFREQLVETIGGPDGFDTVMKDLEI